MFSVWFYVSLRLIFFHRAVKAGPSDLVFPQFDGERVERFGRNSIPQRMRQNPRKMLNARIQPHKLGQIVQTLIFIVGNNRVELRFNINDVNQITMLIERVPV